MLHVNFSHLHSPLPSDVRKLSKREGTNAYTLGWRSTSGNRHLGLLGCGLAGTPIYVGLGRLYLRWATTVRTTGRQGRAIAATIPGLRPPRATVSASRTPALNPTTTPLTFA